MEHMLKKYWFQTLVGLLCVGLVGMIVYNQIIAYSNKLPKLGEAADFQMTNLTGEEVTLKNTDGKVRLIYFFFASCPDVCLPTTHMISKVQEGLKEGGFLGSEARIISITFDPIIDTTENLRAFAALNKADTKAWDFLRGDEEYTKELAEKYKVQVIKDEEGNFIHSNRIVLVDGKRNIRKAYSGNDIDLEFETILQDMVALSKE